MRKKKHAEHVNHERWLVSYADFITLLFAFFVVMFAVSQVDSKKVGRFTESFSKAVGIDFFPETGAGMLPGGDIPLPSQDAQKKGQALPAELSDLRQSILAMSARSELPTSMQVLERRNEIVVRLSDNLLFDTGDDALKEPAHKAIQTLAVELSKRPVDIRVEGHTDDRPIHTPRFRSNWELSTSRATMVVRDLAAAGIAPVHLSAAGYGEFHPLGPNDSDEARKQNRRVDIVVSVTQREGDK